MESSNDKIKELKQLIKAELDFCDENSTPWVCKMKSTDYQKVEKLIIERVSNGGYSINDAIVDIEREYNLNYSND